VKPAPEAELLGGAALQCVRENFDLAETAEQALPNPSPAGAGWESPARECRVEVGQRSESRRDGTSSHAHTLAPEVLVYAIRETSLRALRRRLARPC
jgi:hypothetical protein